MTRGRRHVVAASRSPLRCLDSHTCGVVHGRAGWCCGLGQWDTWLVGEKSFSVHLVPVLPRFPFPILYYVLPPGKARQFFMLCLPLLPVVLACTSWSSCGVPGCSVACVVPKTCYPQAGGLVLTNIFCCCCSTSIWAAPTDWDHNDAGRWSAPCHYLTVPFDATVLDADVRARV